MDLVKGLFMVKAVKQIMLSSAVALALVTGGFAQERRPDPPKKPPEYPTEKDKKKSDENRGSDSRNRDQENKNKDKRKPYFG